ncbi:MAG: hypothetical protein O9327_20385 [Polaromonas sp.]|nr:hypothetical protein [Polaromonas sp.]
MSPKLKAAAWIFGILAAYGASVGIGVYRITSAEMYPLAKRGLASYLAAKQSSEANQPIFFKWWSSWYFRNQRSNGWAEMKMCTSSAACHTVIAYTTVKSPGKWEINVDGQWVILKESPGK